MTYASAIGAFLPVDSRMRRNMAYSRRSGNLPFVRAEKPCDRCSSASLPQVICGAVYHFRTPSPGGQQMSKAIMLPTFFFVLHRWLCATGRGPSWVLQSVMCIGRVGPSAGDQQGYCKERMIDLGVCYPTRTSNKGRSKCVSNSQFSPPQQPSDLQPAVTRWVSRPFWAVPLAALALPHWAATLSRVQPWVQAPMSFTAKPIPADANSLTRRARVFQSHAKRRLAFGQGGVLRFKTPRSEALCSTRS